MALNKVILMGRLTDDPVLKQTPQGVSTVSFTLAVDRDFKSKDGEKQTDFISVVAWRQTAEFVSKYFGKGERMIVEGSLRVRTYEDSEKKKRWVTEVLADSVTFVEKKSNGSKPETESKATKPKAKAKPETEEDFSEDEMPF